MIITDLLHTKSVRSLQISKPEKTQKLRVRVFGKSATIEPPLKRGLRFHVALAGFLPGSRLPKWAKPYYPYLNTLRRYLRDAGFQQFVSEADVVTMGHQGRADLIASGSDRRAVIEVKTCSGALPGEPDAAAVAQAALYAASMPGRVGLVIAYISFSAHEIRIFEWSNSTACDVSSLEPAA